MKRILSFILCFCIVFSLAKTVAVAESGITLEELQEKYPHGTYWNGGNPEGYTDLPCTHHPNCDYEGNCGCNSFEGLGIQCLGFAYQLATLIYGGNQYLDRTNVYNSAAIDDLKAGDIVRYRNGTHSIFVTAVDGDVVTFADCNSDYQCIIRWNQTTSKATLKATFTYLSPAPYAFGEKPSEEGGEGDDIIADCGCSTAYSGNYKCVTGGSNLNIRRGHSVSYSVAGSIPDGAVVYVSMANGEWAHVYYNGVEGYASMEYLELQHSHSYTLLYEEEHPHKEYYLCSCGEWYYTGDAEPSEDCAVCKAEFCEQNGHVYENECDTVCDYCGGERETAHIYDNDCDTSCNECGEEREITHSYDNGCDVDCNECGNLRETEHVYDDERDAECNKCGFVREVIVYVSGDVNGDGEVNNKDFGLLRQYLNGWDVTIDELASDVNRDGEVNNKDLGLLRQYLNGWDVELK